MFISPQSFITSIQSAKRMFANTFITDPTFNKVANDYITAQEEFANMLVNNTLEVAKYCTNGTASQWFNARSK